MKRVLCLRFPNWPVQRLHVLGNDESPGPTALYCSPEIAATDTHPSTTDDYRYLQRMFRAARTGPTVIAVNESAWPQGVRPGMPLAEARSMASGQTSSSLPVEFSPWTAGQDRVALTAVAEEVRLFSPIIGLDELPLPDSLLLDVTGCGPLFGGESALTERLIRRMQTIGFRPRAAISESVATAWAFAHADNPPSTESKHRRSDLRSNEWNLPAIIIPPGQARLYLDELPVPSGRLHPDDVDILQQLGIHSLKGVLNLPLSDLPTRLSSGAVTRIRQLLGDQEELITPLPEADPVQEKWTSEFPAQNRKAVRQVLDHLCTRIAETLQRRLVGATQLSCTLTLENGSDISFAAEFVRPMQSEDMLQDMLSLQLNQQTVSQSVTAVRIAAGISPLPKARQRDLFSTTEHIRPQEDLATLVNRISNRLGKQAALQAELTTDARPEFQTQLVPVMAGNSAGLNDRLNDLVTPQTMTESERPLLDRPIRLLPEPQSLTMTDLPESDEEIRLDGVQHIVQRTIGPERYQTAWWQETATHRDYYVVQTTQGARFWLFCDLQSHQWFLHGIFD